ncbi:linear amide C-N hydrolase [Comamonas composti]|uniref:linear amide C-N hydrolase n=1 Tax=Comamonas composti TaxID=408558 RepID=UPI0004250063|nr:linear amide C-N hydrolase [Comamonas composti]
MNRLTRIGVTLAAAAALMAAEVQACTRVIYEGPNGTYLTGRSMDFKDPMVSNLWVFPRGMQRHGAAGPRSVQWTSSYGSLIVSGYEISAVDGMNEAGLNANLLWLANAKYPEDDGRTPRISLAIWAQYFLDQFATVSEAVKHAQAMPLQVVSGEVPGRPGSLAPLHLSLSDATGDSAILEWIDGKLNIHHSRDYRVMTNEPAYEDQLAIQRYWSGVNGRTFLPGSNRASDRFVRANYYTDAVLKSDDPRTAAAAVFSVVRNVSVPYGISQPDAPNLSTTRWRIVADHKNRLFYAESAISPNVLWVDMKRLDFSKGAPTRVLDLGVDMARTLSGEVSGQFVAAKPFTFMEAQ